MRCFPDKSVSLSEKRLNTIPVLIQHKSLALLFFLEFFIFDYHSSKHGPVDNGITMTSYILQYITIYPIRLVSLGVSNLTHTLTLAISTLPVLTLHFYSLFSQRRVIFYYSCIVEHHVTNYASGRY